MSLSMSKKLTLTLFLLSTSTSISTGTEAEDDGFYVNDDDGHALDSNLTDSSSAWLWEPQIPHVFGARDRHCKGDNDVMYCFQKCRSPKEVEEAWADNNILRTEEERKTEILEVLKRAWTKQNRYDGFSCGVKCLVDPVRTACRHNCADDGEFIQRCIDRNTTEENRCDTKSGDWNSAKDNKKGKCLNCLFEEIAGNVICPAFYPGRKTNCKLALQECLNNITPPLESLEDIMECYSIKRMENDLEFYNVTQSELPTPPSGYAQPNNDSRRFYPCFDVNGDGLLRHPVTNKTEDYDVKCDDFMLPFLSTKYCHDICDSPKENTSITVDNFDFCLENDNETIGQLGCNFNLNTSSSPDTWASCAYECADRYVVKNRCKTKNPKTFLLPSASKCRWTVDFSQANTPNVLTAVYFNEKIAVDLKDKLLRPNSHKYLMEVKDGNTTGYFSFPYFIVLRALCDKGRYDESFYKLFMHGQYPEVELEYFPRTNRDPVPRPYKGTFRAALVSLKRDPSQNIISKNPLIPEGDDVEMENVTETACHMKICYPGFAVPLLLYRMHLIEVKVKSIDVFLDFDQRVHVAAYHSRDIDGDGALYITNVTIDSRSVVTPNMVFPSRRVHAGEDDDVLEYFDDIDCQRNCPKLIPRHGQIGEKDPLFPIDGEDIFELKWSFGAAPAIIIAGFYDPSIVIYGDGDMNHLELARWTLNDPAQNVSIFSGKTKEQFRCFGTKKANGYRKLMYSQIDITDKDYPLMFYRIRTKPQNFEDGLPTPAIYSAISMVDRLLLTTSRGVVTFYGNANSTLSTNTIFKAPEDERVEACFKFLRVANRGAVLHDLAVGVTYDYKKGSKQVSQEIYVGTLNQYGEKMEWTTVGNDKEEEEYGVIDREAGKVVPLVPKKKGEIPVKRIQSSNTSSSWPTSEVERICIKAYKDFMLGDPDQVVDVIIDRERGWCEAIDAAPVIQQYKTILLLIRMRVKYVGSALLDDQKNRILFFYVLASHSLLSEAEKKSGKPTVWEITNILPRIPCQVEHKEAVINFGGFTREYFARDAVAGNGNTSVGCHNLYGHFHNTKIYLSGMAFTRQFSNHMYVYGASLLQSPDAGRNFVAVRGFPPTDSYRDQRLDPRYRISVMTFDLTGHFAFLTNNRELFIGTTGHQDVIRLRPSDGYAMDQLTASTSVGIVDAIPFSLAYDSRNYLFEVVALVSAEGNVERIFKKNVQVGFYLRYQKMVNEAYIAAKLIRLKEARPRSNTTESEIIHRPNIFTLICPFSDYHISHNYSTNKYQFFLFQPPTVHAGFGRAMSNPGLWAFQVVTFSLIWEAIFEQKFSALARLKEADPFKKFHKDKNEVANIGHLKFILGNKDEHGILINPGKYIRLANSSNFIMYREYFLDYNTTVTIKLTYSIKSTAVIGLTDFTKQKISQIQLTVDNPNGTILQIDTEKIPLPNIASVEFHIHIRVIQLPGLRQRKPGEDNLPFRVVFHLIGGFGNCVSRRSDKNIRDTLSTKINVGCKPSEALLFDWNNTLHSIKFRDKEAHFGNKAGECYDNAVVCFFARSPMVLHFVVYDIPTQKYIPYLGNYVMRIKGGGYSKDSIDIYPEEDQVAYNIPGVSDVSLIWNEWKIGEAGAGQKVEREQPHYNPLIGTDKKRSYKESVLQGGKSAIQWVCHSLSPCARISLNAGLQTVYWFKVFITNKDVENNTLCLYELEFDLMLYGFPPSPETQLLTTFIFCLLMLGILYVLFICCRRHKRVWKTTKIKCRGWVLIVRDTFPKVLKTIEEPSSEEAKSQREKDKIILSLQGHLKIPQLDDASGTRRNSDEQAKSQSEQHSPGGSSHTLDSSVSSSFSLDHSSRQASAMSIRGDLPLGTPAGSRRQSGITWTDMVYEQVISKRLATIVDKNRKMKKTILRRTSKYDAGSGQEKKYETEHKKTVRDELESAPPSKQSEQKPGPSSKK